MKVLFKWAGTRKKDFIFFGLWFYKRIYAVTYMATVMRIFFFCLFVCFFYLFFFFFCCCFLLLFYFVFVWSFLTPQGLYYISANRKGSGETAQMRLITWAFASRLCDKYPFLKCWLKYLKSCCNNRQFAKQSKIPIETHKILPGTYWSDAAFCNIWIGSKLFLRACLSELWGQLQ